MRAKQRPMQIKNLKENRWNSRKRSFCLSFAPIDWCFRFLRLKKWQKNNHNFEFKKESVPNSWRKINSTPNLKKKLIAIKADGQLLVLFSFHCQQWKHEGSTRMISFPVSEGSVFWGRNLHFVMFFVFVFARRLSFKESCANPISHHLLL